MNCKIHKINIDMFRLPAIITLIIASHVCSGQKLVASLQPTTYVDFMAAHEVSDSITRYYFTSRESRYKSYYLSYIIDFNNQSKTFNVQPLVENQFSVFTSSYELIVLPFPDGSSIIGSNGFQCDITASELLQVDADGTW